MVALCFAGCVAVPQARPGKGAVPGQATPSAVSRTPDPPLRVEGAVATTTVNGIPIIVKRVPGVEFVSASLVIKGGARNWGKDDAGIERIGCAAAAGGGPSGTSKAAFQARLVELGAQIRATTSEDFSEFDAKTLTATWEETFGLLLDVFMQPALTAEEIELRKGQQIWDLRAEIEDPDRQLRLLGRQMLFKGHAYENPAGGTIETVSRLQRPAIQQHLAKLRESRRLVLVVVGDVDPERVVSLTRDRLGDLPAGDYVDAPPAALSFSRPGLTTKERALPTNFIVSLLPAPTWTEPTFAASTMAMEVLSSRLYQEVRAKRGLSYAPAAFSANDSYLPVAGMYVSTTDPNQTMQIMWDTLKDLQGHPVSAQDLEGSKAVFVTRYLMDFQTTEGMAALMAKAQIYKGDWRFARVWAENIKAVTPADIQSFVRQRLVNFQTVVLGDQKRIDRHLFSSH
jgi:predicted Zn-dependent peptidase